MANINVNRNVSDAFYRYKMPRLIAKVEGKGNGIKTVIDNMPAIAKALSRPPTYPTKYFGCELGAQTQFDSKNDRYIVNGAHDSSKLQDLLDGFIRKFVLCPACDNPETNLIVQAKKGMIVQRCIACGNQGNIDMKHKLTTFILKNPPEPETISSTNNGSTNCAPADGKKNKEKKTKGKGSTTESGNGDGTAENHRTTPPKKIDEDDEDWCEDTSAAAVKERMEALSGAAKTMTISDDLEKTQQERVDIFYSFVKQRKVADQLTGTDREKEIVNEAERLEIREQAPLVLAELLYDANILEQIKHYRSLFYRLTHDNPKAQRYLLGAFEQLVGAVHRETLMPKVAHILKAFYEYDIVDESVLIEWDEKPSKKFTSVSKEISKEIHAKAAPLIKWLKEAEEESSGNDEPDSDEEDVEVVYKETGSSKIESEQAPVQKPVAINATINGDGSDEEDVDIDAI